MPLLIIIRFIPVRRNLNVTSVTKHAQRREALKCIKRFILVKRNINVPILTKKNCKKGKLITHLKSHTGVK